MVNNTTMSRFQRCVALFSWCKKWGFLSLMLGRILYHRFWVYYESNYYVAYFRLKFEYDRGVNSLHISLRKIVKKKKDFPSESKSGGFLDCFSVLCLGRCRLHGNNLCRLCGVVHFLHTKQALCDLALLFAEGDEETVVVLVVNWLKQLFKHYFNNMPYSSHYYRWIYVYTYLNFLQCRPFGVSLLTPGHDENSLNL